ncbi:uncharacterized protein PHACADRAFT_258137 [Phanerochaete carnosa HHB-10118-sp]|uniref:DBF4-type domain-containing protein n=1 Tax=Phanerochaete carnosa (strain HHB-10118-sp) TaxID=650164 RepID=K5W5X3_PHACS|nr:uncharacterized protein PHACADRAFT_258137 [Phanerochaete carnosa HHB-10118-sp]EKM54344.1 hypothetical protein PHACADRAFT_258137 [Phanerochaete carnosa HHB-10118-sp]
MRDERRRDIRDARPDAKEEKDKIRAAREAEFRIKYTRAFPNWTFHFDLDAHQPELAALKNKLERRVVQLGAKIDGFFSKEVTHLITCRAEEVPGNKENSRARGARDGGLLGSPIKLKSRTTPCDNRASEIVKKAQEFGIKVWDMEKLTSVLDRCQAPPNNLVATPVSASGQHTAKQLSRLLESERLHGTTERDPTQRRHDYVYFSKGSYFVLIEDMRQELATIAALEYPVQKTRDGKERGSWPVLHCHPRARGPFIEYNEREERRREKMDQADKEREEELARRKAEVREEERRRRAKLQAQFQAQRHRDLRRAVSMQSLKRHTEDVEEEFVDLDAGFEGEAAGSAAASGYLASGAYVAASGNSVSITSAAGTTSTTGVAMRSMALPPSLREKIENQVITSRRLPDAGKRLGKENLMGPPLVVPERPQRTLRKSKSTTTMRLAKREEGSKPGYCECCRVKFDDFKQHIYSKRHRKFAEDDNNFAALDVVLSRVRRRTLEEVETEQAMWDNMAARHDESDDDTLDELEADDVEFSDDDASLVTPPAHIADEIQWKEWVEEEAFDEI